MNIEDVRKAFEGWAAGQFPNATSDISPHTGCYYSGDYEAAWRGWQAALASPVSGAAGFVATRPGDPLTDCAILSREAAEALVRDLGDGLVVVPVYAASPVAGAGGAVAWLIEWKSDGSRSVYLDRPATSDHYAIVPLYASPGARVAGAVTPASSSSAQVGEPVVKACDDPRRDVARSARSDSPAERLLAMIFERHWDGTIGRYPTWHLRGDFRHILAGMRGETLAEAVESLITKGTPACCRRAHAGGEPCADHDQEAGAVDVELPSVAGDSMDRSIAEHEQACRVLLRDEQEKPMPDTHLIAVLCDSVRMGREYVNAMKRPPYAPVAEAGGVAADIVTPRHPHLYAPAAIAAVDALIESGEIERPDDPECHAGMYATAHHAIVALRPEPVPTPLLTEATGAGVAPTKEERTFYEACRESMERIEAGDLHSPTADGAVHRVRAAYKAMLAVTTKGAPHDA